MNPEPTNERWHSETLSIIHNNLNEQLYRGEEAAHLIHEKISHVFRPPHSHVSNNPQRQKEIFEALSLQDLNKIILNLRDDNECTSRPPRPTPYLSTPALRTLLPERRNKAGSGQTARHPALLWPSISQPTQICLSGIPESIHKYPSTLKSTPAIRENA